MLPLPALDFFSLCTLGSTSLLYQLLSPVFPLPYFNIEEKIMIKNFTPIHIKELLLITK